MEGMQTIQMSGISLNSIVRASTGPGKISLPGPSSIVKYSGLKHITVMPQPINQISEGISLSKLRALDTLIDILAKSVKISSRPNTSSLSSQKIDSLITQSVNHLKDLSSRNGYMSPLNLKGMIVNGLV